MLRGCSKVYSKNLGIRKLHFHWVLNCRTSPRWIRNQRNKVSEEREREATGSKYLTEHINSQNK